MTALYYLLCRKYRNGVTPMKTKGIMRRVDELGRIVIPIEMRRMMEIGDREPMDISVEGDGIVLRKRRQSCVFCSSTKNLVEYRGKYICAGCLTAVGEK